MPLYTEAFTHRCFYTQKLLDTEAFTPRNFYTQKLLHKEASTNRSFYKQKLLHTEASTHRSFYTQMLLHIDAFRHRSFYTKLLHREVFTQTTLLHTEAFTHRGFYTQLLHTKAFTHKLQNRNFTQVFAVGPSFCAKRLHPKLWNRNFTALYAVGPSFRAKRLHPKLWNRNFTALYAVGPSFRAKRLHPKLRAKRKMKMENVKNDVLPIGFGHFVEVHGVLCLPRKTSQIRRRFHKTRFWTVSSKFTKYCACHEKWDPKARLILTHANVLATCQKSQAFHVFAPSARCPAPVAQNDVWKRLGPPNGTGAPRLPREMDIAPKTTTACL